VENKMKLIVYLLLLWSFVGQVAAEEQKEFYDGGELKSWSKHVDGQLVAQKKYSLSGQLVYELSIDAQGDRYEIERKYHDKGLLAKERPLKNGLVEGIEKEYYKNGQLRAKRTYVAGKKQGKARGFYESGAIQGDWNFEKGEPVAAKIYYMTGNVHLDHHFENGKKTV
jgi:antitoxin component YwqK of YwqJK toxin-antitoxin module